MDFQEASPWPAPLHPGLQEDRTTRSGRKFSPYTFSVGDPVSIPPEFSVQQAMATLAITSNWDACDDELLGDLEEGEEEEEEESAGYGHTGFDARMLVAELDVYAKHGASGSCRSKGSSSSSARVASAPTDAGQSSPISPSPSPHVRAAGSAHPTHSELREKTGSSRRRERRNRKAGLKCAAPTSPTPPTSAQHQRPLGAFPPAAATPLHTGGSRRQRVNRQLTLRSRERDRELGVGNSAASGDAVKQHIIKACIAKRRLAAWSSAVRFKLSCQVGLRENVTAPSWTCKRPSRPDAERTKCCALDLRIRFGIYFIDWSGDECRLLIDRNDVVFGALAGMPRGDAWQGVHDGAVLAMRVARTLLQNLSSKHWTHRRGEYLALSCGISHGGGQTKPSNLRWSRAVAEVLSFLSQHPAFQRISGFANCILQAYAPRLHQFCCGVLDSLQERDHRLARPFQDSAFAACCFNLGPQTVSHPHRDHANLSWGWCAVTALGPFDAKKGGHLTLWDVSCAVPLRPGATVIIPSALLEHSNAAILASEERMSFVQFSAGGLFRWAENGFQTEAAWRSKATKEDVRLRDADMQLRWSKGLSMLSTLGEFAPAPAPRPK